MKAHAGKRKTGRQAGPQALAPPKGAALSGSRLSLRHRLPAVLRRLRLEAGLTQRALAARLSLSHVGVHKAETADRRLDVEDFCDWVLACDARPVRVLRELLSSDPAARMRRDRKRI